MPTKAQQMLECDDCGKIPYQDNVMELRRNGWYVWGLRTFWIPNVSCTVCLKARKKIWDYFMPIPNIGNSFKILDDWKQRTRNSKSYKA